MTSERDATGLRLHVLGVGTVVAPIVERRPIDYHGMPGLAERLCLHVAGHGRVEALRVGRNAPIVLDPRVRVIGPA